MPRVRLLPPLALLFSVGLSFAAACTVDSSRFTFDDEKFEAKQSGGRKATGGSGEGGDNDSGGASASGGRASGGNDSGGDGGGPSGGAAATCTTSELECNGKQLEICTGSDWIAVGEPCEFVCKNDQCTGVCVPKTTECVNENEQRTCNDDGQWETAPCEFACMGDKCGGECKPGTFECGTEQDGQIPIKVCNGGDWDATTTICDMGCTDGVCTGGCDGGDTQCGQTAEGKPAVLTCPENGADWSEATLTPCVNQACSEGACVGECEPGLKTCDGQSRKVCSAQGTWGSETCPYVCTPEACSGECVPGTEQCDDSNNVLSCSSSGKWEVKEKCANEGLICVHLSEKDKACGECNPAPDRSYCYFRTLRACGEKGLWETTEDCGKRDGVCYKGACLDVSVCPSTTVNGCLDASTGWQCEVKGKPANTCRCDCESGEACGRGCIGIGL